MRLYEVTMVGIIDEDTSLTTEKEVYIPTDETYPNTDKFLNHARKNGEKYEGKTWILLGETGEEQAHVIERESKFVTRALPRKAAA